ncbi:MAG: uracil-DNA glycosylase family protein [Bellilinea sp.]
MDQKEILGQVAAEVMACTQCQLSVSRKNSVPGEGQSNAEVMFIGEGPGFYENEQGRPFVGPAGKFLDELLQRAGLHREKVFITNVVKCRPPGNRDPLPEELSACNNYLERQIEAINPIVIVTLGRYSMAKFMPNVRISDVHGQSRWVNGRLIVAMFHPAAALHQPSLKNAILEDFGRIQSYLTMARTNRDKMQAVTPVAETSTEPQKKDESPTQLSLF